MPLFTTFDATTPQLPSFVTFTLDPLVMSEKSGLVYRTVASYIEICGLLFLCRETGRQNSQGWHSTHDHDSLDSARGYGSCKDGEQCALDF